MSIKKLGIILGTTLLILFLLGSGVILILRANKLKNAVRTTETVSAIEQEKMAIEKGWDEAVQQVYERDKDFDGLSDTEEAKIGTKIEVADTDKDGLSDSAEVNIYKTDPLKADTDGDGLSDGREVARMADPLKK